MKSVVVVAVFALFSQNTFAEPTIGNGVLTKEFPAVVKLTMGVQGREMAGCTGTWISPKHVLTASHCTLIAQPIAPGYSMIIPFDSYSINGVPVQSGRVITHSALDKKALGKIAVGKLTDFTIEHDQAIIEVDNPPAHEYYALSEFMQKIGAGVRLVGFGFGKADYDFDFMLLRWKIDPQDGWSSGEKRTGTNTVAAYKGTRIIIKGSADVGKEYLVFDKPTGKNVVPMQGDSGGPLLISKVINGKKVYQVIGVASAIHYERWDKAQVESYYSSVHDPLNAAWIKSVVSK